MDWLRRVTLLLFILKSVFSANILYMAHFGSPSHHIWNMALVEGLLGKGHSITMLTHIKVDKPLKNLTVIMIEGLYEELARKFDLQPLTNCSTLLSIKYTHGYPECTCSYDLHTEGLQTLLNYPKDRFDLIIFDATLGQCLYPVIDIFNRPPVIALSLLPPLLSRPYGVHIHSSYMPFFNSDLTDEMNFFERVANFIYVHGECLYFRYIAQPREFKLAQERFGEEIRHFDEIERNISLIFTNSDPNLDYPIALPPNVIPLGGIHIKPSGKLPDDLKQIMDNAKHGVIYFSFGTNIMSNVLGSERRKAFLDAFRRLPQTVLWKFDLENVDNLPDNVIIRKWFPQRDLLGHPNLKLFISQCGGFSFQEAIYHAIPLVGVPFVIDQFTITKRLDKWKLGKFLDNWNLTEDNIYQAITEVINNPIYRENMKVSSKKYRDQLQSPLERGLYWTEYLLRHGTAEHLTPAGRNMPIYQIENWDVISFLVFCLVLIYFASQLLIVTCRWALVAFGINNKPKRTVK